MASIWDFSSLKWRHRLVERIVPASRIRPLTSMTPKGMNSLSKMPWYPFWIPTTSMPRLTPVRTMERMAGFIPGESPPEVITPIRFNINKRHWGDGLKKPDWNRFSKRE